MLVIVILEKWSHVYRCIFFLEKSKHYNSNILKYKCRISYSLLSQNELQKEEKEKPPREFGLQKNNAYGSV